VAGIEGVLASLASRAHEKFDTTRSEHLQTLANLSLLAFPGVPFEVRSPRWRELGFQSEDPATDLRGAGYLGLLHFTHLLAETGPSFRRSNVSDTFPLALASLSCTAMLCRYFGLSKTLIFPGSDAPQARDDVVRSFLLLQAKGAGGHDVLQVLHSRLLRHVARIWSCMLASLSDPEMAIMHFNEALRLAYCHLRYSLNAIPCPWTLPSVATALEDVDVRGGKLPFLWAAEDALCGATPGLCAPALTQLIWLLRAVMLVSPSGQRNF